MTMMMTTTNPLHYISNRNTVFTGPALISLLPTLAHIKSSHSVFTWAVCTKYCIYPGCGRHTGNVHHAVLTGVKMCLDTALVMQQQNKAVRYRSWNICGNSL